MWGITQKAALVTVSVVIAVVLIDFAARLAAGEPYPLFVFVLDVLMPASMGFPIAYALFWQQQKLKAATAELQEINAQLARKVTRDAMTGFLNREAFFDHVKRLRRRSDDGALLLIDADRFKEINDTYGHLVGDDALRLIAEAIARSVREGDAVGRVGGEEFCVFLPATERWEAVVVAERLRANVEQVAFHPQGEARHRLSVSIGIAMHRHDATMPGLMRRADMALYRAKENGRNMVVMDGESRLVA